MLDLAHRLLVVIYLALPIVAGLMALGQAWRTRSSGPLRLLLGLAAVAALTAVVFCWLNAWLCGLVPRPRGILLAAYFALAMILLLRGFDHLLARLLSPLHVGRFLRRLRYVLAFLLRAAVLVCIVLPYVIIAAATYRPELSEGHDPQQQFGWDYSSISISGRDAWWIPADDNPQRATVLLVPGLGGTKSTQLVLAKYLLPAGYNVLAIDPRRPGGLHSFGDLERHDVLAALDWLKQNRPGDRLFALGSDVGAAAILAAAVEPQGQAIQAIVAYDPFDHLRAWAQDASRLFGWPLNQLAWRVGLPLASLQTGAPLTRFNPGDLADRLWPRPLLVIQSERGALVPFSQGEILFNRLTQPKQRLIVPKDHHRLLRDRSAAAEVLEFFRTAHPLPVI